MTALTHTRRILPLVGVMLLAAAGCGEPGPEIYPVTGQVFHKGQPAAGATVSLHPLDQPNGRVLAGEVRPDGTFAVTTNTIGDGAPPGRYAVCLTWTQSIKVNDADRETPDVFQRKYADPKKPHSRIEVKRGTNELPRIDIP